MMSNAPCAVLTEKYAVALAGKQGDDTSDSRSEHALSGFEFLPVQFAILVLVDHAEVGKQGVLGR